MHGCTLLVRVCAVLLSVLGLLCAVYCKLLIPCAFCSSVRVLAKGMTGRVTKLRARKYANPSAKRVRTLTNEGAALLPCISINTIMAGEKLAFDPAPGTRVG
jgi:hypothetical protein